MNVGNGIQNTGYCGLVCGICTHAADACQGCREGGGDAGCIQRKCCLVKGLSGCWQCEEFPCGKGFFGDEAWRGLCIGFCRVIRESGVEACIEKVRAVMGERVDCGDYRNREAEEIVEVLGCRR